MLPPTTSSEDDPDFGMPHYRLLPRWLRLVGRTLRVGTYALVMIVGVGDLLFPSSRFDNYQDLLEAWGFTMIVLGAVALGATAFHRWRVEWVTSFWLGAIVAFRAVVIWLSRDPPPPLADGSLAAIVSGFLILRGLDLTVFDIQTRGWAKRLRDTE